MENIWSTGLMEETIALEPKGLRSRAVDQHLDDELAFW